MKLRYLALFILTTAAPVRAQLVVSETSTDYGDIQYASPTFNDGFSGYTSAISTTGSLPFEVGNDNVIFHAYASFSTASFTTTVTSAQLFLHTGGFNDSNQFTALTLYSYTGATTTADATSFNNMIAGSAIGFTELPVLNGATWFDDDLVGFQLNAAGVAALNTAIEDGTSFQITAATAPLANYPTSSALYFGLSGTDNSSVELDATETPEPSTWVMLFGGCGALVFLGRRKIDMRR